MIDIRVIKALQTISSEIDLSRLLSRVMSILTEHARAQRGFLVLAEQDHLLIEAEIEAATGIGTVLRTLPLEQAEDRLSTAIVHDVVRTRESVALCGGLIEGAFTADPYILKYQPKSVLCLPITGRRQCLGALYLENNLTTDGFPPERMELLSLLAAQAAIALENARLYANLDERLQRRAAELELANEQLMREIDERKQAEEALRKSKEQLAAMTDELPALVAYIDTDHRYVYVNQRYAEWYGFSKEEMIGKYTKDTVHPEAYQRARKLHEKALSGERVSFENYAPDREGRIHNLWVDLVPHVGNDGKIKGFVGLILDVTEVKQQEEELRKARDAAEFANQAKSAFLANMSHELRTPLNSILGFAQLMARNPKIPLEEQENLDIIQRSGEHLLTLINQVLDLSKIEAGRVTLDEKNFDLYYLLDDLHDMFSLKAQKKGMRLRFERANDVPQHVRTDEVKLRQVLINLLSNAMKFTEEGGVTVRIENCQLNIENWEEEKNRQSSIVNLQFSISDTGPGIVAEEMNHLFEAFAQTVTGRQAPEGTGLGLPISRKFVQLMGGDITVRSEVGRGSTFTFEIHVGVVSAAAIERQQSARRVIALETGQPRYRMLIVDDKPDNRKLLIKLLNPFGFELREAVNGQEAIDIWEQWEPHLIWMDLRMPVLDGYEATKHIKSEIRNSQSEVQTVVIAVTASSFEEERAVILSAGCDDFLRKPFQDAEVFDLLHKHLGVRFVYGDGKRQKAKGERQRAEEVLTPEVLAALPDELRIGLQHAAEVIDLEMANRLIDRVREHNEPLAEALANLVTHYRFDTLQALFEKIK